jgi:hypothetical protein
MKGANIPAYWWECLNCDAEFEFGEIAESRRGIAHYIQEVLIPSDWDQTLLIKKCPKCGNEALRIGYIFPRAEETQLLVKHAVGLIR